MLSDTINEFMRQNKLPKGFDWYVGDDGNRRLILWIHPKGEHKKRLGINIKKSWKKNFEKIYATIYFVYGNKVLPRSSVDKQYSSLDKAVNWLINYYEPTQIFRMKISTPFERTPGKILQIPRWLVSVNTTVTPGLYTFFIAKWRTSGMALSNWAPMKTQKINVEDISVEAIEVWIQLMFMMKGVQPPENCTFNTDINREWFENEFARQQANREERKISLPQRRTRWISKVLSRIRGLV